MGARANLPAASDCSATYPEFVIINLSAFTVCNFGKIASSSTLNYTATVLWCCDRPVWTADRP